MNPIHYPSLELCKKLTEIGFPTTFQHRWENESTVIWCWEIPEWFYVSPSVMEMLDVMPKEIPYTIKVSRVEVPVHRNLVIGKNTLSGWYYCKYVYGTMYGRLTDNKIVQFMNTAKHINWTLPNALAEMILWLVENNYISFTN